MPRHVTEADLLTFLDDTVTASNKTWSSTKIAAYVTTATSGLPVIADGLVSNTSVWSSQKTNNEINTRYAKVASPTTSNFVAFGAGGTLVDSGQSPSSYATAGHTHGILSGTITGFPSVSSQSGKVLSNNGSSLLWIDVASGLPAQGTHAGKFLTTDGTNASWAVINKTTVGLSNVDNTSDAAKPISTAVADALAGKANISNLFPTTSPVSGSGSISVNVTNGFAFYFLTGNANLSITVPTGRLFIIQLENITASTIVVSLPANATGGIPLTSPAETFTIRAGKTVILMGIYFGSGPVPITWSMELTQ